MTTAVGGWELGVGGEKVDKSGFYFRKPKERLELLKRIEAKPGQLFVRRLLKDVALNLGYIPRHGREGLAQ